MRRLRHKIFLSTVTWAALVALLIGGLALRRLGASLEREFQLRAISISRSFQRRVSQDLASGDRARVQAALDSLIGEPDLAEAAVWSPGGAVLAARARDGEAAFPADAALFARALRAFTPQLAEVREAGRSYKIVYQRIWTERPAMATVGVCGLRFDYFRVGRELEREGAAAVAALALAALLMLPFDYRFSARITRPLEQLRRAAEAVGRGDFTAAVEARGNDEVAELARTFSRMVVGLQERDMIRRAFGRYVPREVAEGFMAGTLSLELGGERRNVSVLMADIRGFTQLSEALAPEEVVLLLNRFFGEMVAAISAHDGTVDKFIGDAVLAVFGWPLPRAEHARLAVEAGLEMQRRLTRLNRELVQEGRAPLAMGIGISCGPVVAGNVGTRERTEYTVIGDTVNLAARIEGVNTRFGTELLVSAAVRESTRERFVFEDFGEVVVRGRKEPTHLYSVVGPRVCAASPQPAEPAKLPVTGR